MLLLNIIIFIVTLIFYVHIYNHLYVNNKLDIQYIPSYYKQAVDDLVDLKSPFYFKTNEIQLPKSLLLFKNNGMKDLIKQNANNHYNLLFFLPCAQSWYPNWISLWPHNAF